MVVTVVVPVAVTVVAGGVIVVPLHVCDGQT